MVLVSCGKPSATQNGSTASANKDAGTVVVYSGRSEKLVGPIIKQFEEKTGIKAKVKYAKTPQLAATLLEEGDASPADVFLAQDPGGISATAELLTPLDPTIISLVPSWANDPAGKWVGISGRARTVVYSTKSLSPEQLPSTLAGFTDSKWKGKIGWAPTNASFQTMVTAMRKTWGEEKTKSWLLGIQKNNPKVFPKNTPIVAAVGADEIEVGFVNHYYLYRFLKEDGEDFAARNFFLPGGGPGSLVMASGAGILKTSKNSSQANAFIRYLLSEDAQTYFATKTVEFPLAANVASPKDLPAIKDIKKPDLALSDLQDLKGTQSLLRETGILF
ncbi:MAG: iron ABC transporter substrate-binding protein [Candidatus Lindowbacteria bacterium]|nr:iron ABC transporter substrate-binding protein [Candidatus Lindowbacteria bacterium]